MKLATADLISAATAAAGVTCWLHAQYRAAAGVSPHMRDRFRRHVARAYGPEQLRLLDDLHDYHLEQGSRRR